MTKKVTTEIVKSTAAVTKRDPCALYIEERDCMLQQIDELRMVAFQLMIGIRKFLNSEEDAVEFAAQALEDCEWRVSR